MKTCESVTSPVRSQARALSNRLLIVLLSMLLLAMPVLGTGCTSNHASSDNDTLSSGTESSGAAEAEAPLRQVIIGSLATEDILPLWVAEAENLFEEVGIEATVQTFQSAQELSTAIVSGAVDMAMTDIMVSATLTAAGTPVVMEWVTLGTTAEQGRFGIMTSPESGITNLKQLADTPIGVGSCTVPEYVMDKLLEEAGVSAEHIVGEEIKKVPVRYEMMQSNQVAAAALPGSLLALGEASGMVLLADDTSGENLSQSVMVVREDLGTSRAGIAMIEKVAEAWDSAVARINTNPENYRSLLVEKAQLPDMVRDTYPISVYPTASKPSSSMVNPVLDWMLKKGYLSSELDYDFSTGLLSA